MQSATSAGVVFAKTSDVHAGMQYFSLYSDTTMGQMHVTYLSEFGTHVTVVFTVPDHVPITMAARFVTVSMNYPSIALIIDCNELRPTRIDYKDSTGTARTSAGPMLPQRPVSGPGPLLLGAREDAGGERTMFFRGEIAGFRVTSTGLTGMETCCVLGCGEYLTASNGGDASIVMDAMARRATLSSGTQGERGVGVCVCVGGGGVSVSLDICIYVV